jgi:hypothetical protein
MWELFHSGAQGAVPPRGCPLRRTIGGRRVRSRRVWSSVRDAMVERPVVSRRARVTEPRVRMARGGAPRPPRVDDPAARHSRLRPPPLRSPPWGGMRVGTRAEDGLHAMGNAAAGTLTCVSPASVSVVRRSPASVRAPNASAHSRHGVPTGRANSSLPTDRWTTAGSGRDVAAKAPRRRCRGARGSGRGERRTTRALCVSAFGRTASRG